MEIKLTHYIYGVDGAGNTFWIIFDHISRLEDSLNRAGFDVELIVAETIFST